MSRIRCFLLEPTDEQRVYLRRYRSSTDAADKCPGLYGYHDSDLLIATTAIDYGERDRADGKRGVIEALDENIWRPSDEDPRWPGTCDYCAYAYEKGDARQVHQEQLWRRTDTDELLELHEAPAGAMWFAWWFEDMPSWCGPDGKCLVVKTPGGDWMVDGRASNCTLPDDREHRCWIRHGTAPDITVDKNGLTCAAGAGSIMAGSYHGFLQNGHLT